MSNAHQPHTWAEPPTLVLSAGLVAKQLSLLEGVIQLGVGVAHLRSRGREEGQGMMGWENDGMRGVEFEQCPMPAQQPRLQELMT